LDAQGQADEKRISEPLSFALCSNEKELNQVVERAPGIAILKTWDNTIVGWENTMQKGIENEFARLESFFSGKKEEIYTAQANIDLKLSLRKYFAIDVDGSPVEAGPKPSAPVILKRWYLETGNLRKISLPRRLAFI
jgi:hypothetical protein